MLLQVYKIGFVLPNPQWLRWSLLSNPQWLRWSLLSNPLWLRWSLLSNPLWLRWSLISNAQWLRWSLISNPQWLRWSFLSNPQWFPSHPPPPPLLSDCYQQRTSLYSFFSLGISFSPLPWDLQVLQYDPAAPRSIVGAAGFEPGTQNLCPMQKLQMSYHISLERCWNSFPTSQVPTMCTYFLMCWFII